MRVLEQLARAVQRCAELRVFSWEGSLLDGPAGPLGSGEPGAEGSEDPDGVA